MRKWIPSIKTALKGFRFEKDSLVSILLYAGLGGIILIFLFQTSMGFIFLRRGIVTAYQNLLSIQSKYAAENLRFGITSGDWVIVKRLLQTFVRSESFLVGGIVASETGKVLAEVYQDKEPSFLFRKSGEESGKEKVDLPENHTTHFLSSAFSSLLTYTTGNETRHLRYTHEGEEYLLLSVYVPITYEDLGGIYGEGREKSYFLTIVNISEVLKKPLQNLTIATGFLALIIIVLVFGSAFYLVIPRIRDLNDLTTVARSIGEEKDFTRSVPETLLKRGGEVGQLSRAYETVLSSFKDVFQEIRSLSEIVAGHADRIQNVAQEVLRGSQVQSQSADETSASMEEMAALITSVAESSKRLAEKTEEVASQIEEMSSSTEEISRITEQSAIQVEETSTTIEEMVSTFQTLTARVGELTKKGEKMAEMIENAQKAVYESIEVLRDLSKNAMETSRTIGTLVEKSENISKISDTIQDIADLTHILALNAAIEAARAGEAGRGFSVVAEEVRRLAERSLLSAREISQVIREVVKEMNRLSTLSQEGVAVSEKGIRSSDLAMNSFLPAVEHVQQTTSFLREVDQSMKTQVEASRGVLTAISHLNQMTDQVKKATAEQAQVAQGMVKIVEEMRVQAQSVAQATQEQKRGGELVVTAIENITAIAGENLQIMQNLTRISTELSEQAEKLFNLIARYSPKK